MKQEYPEDALPQMETMLDHGRRRIVAANMIAQLKKSLHFMVRGVTIIALVFLVLRALAWLIATPAPSGTQTIIISLIFIIAVCVYSVITGIRNAAVLPDQIAERLDGAQETHNKIATAIELLKSGDDSPFARAAINDGWTTLESIQQEEPLSENPIVPWRSHVLRSIVAIVLFIVGISLIPKSKSPSKLNTPQNTIVNNLGLPDDSTNSDNPKPTDAVIATVEDTTTEDQQSELAKKATTPKPSTPKDPATSSPAKGKTGRHSSAESRDSKSASKSSSSASGGGAKSKPSDTEPAKPKAKSETPKKPTIAKKPKPQEKQKEAGSINARGSSGSSSSSTAQNEWSSKIKAKADDSNDSPQEEEPDEEADPNELRAGVQPSLKNRSSKISRELSLISGSTKSNKQKRGRGGPGGTKKSRGTATMIMGVPVPGFVRGKLLPGATKSTQEEVEPTPRPGKYGIAANLQEGNPEEDTQERFRPSSTTAEQARKYLIQYHAEHENKRTEDTTGK